MPKTTTSVKRDDDQGTITEDNTSTQAAHVSNEKSFTWDVSHLQHSAPSGARGEAVVMSFGTTCILVSRQVIETYGNILTLYDRLWGVPCFTTTAHLLYILHTDPASEFIRAFRIQ
jgi:hypothetical protein